MNVLLVTTLASIFPSTSNDKHHSYSPYNCTNVSDTHSTRNAHFYRSIRWYPSPFTIGATVTTVSDVNDSEVQDSARYLYREILLFMRQARRKRFTFRTDLSSGTPAFVNGLRRYVRASISTCSFFNATRPMYRSCRNAGAPILTSFFSNVTCLVHESCQNAEGLTSIRFPRLMYHLSPDTDQIGLSCLFHVCHWISKD